MIAINQGVDGSVPEFLHTCLRPLWPELFVTWNLYDISNTYWVSKNLMETYANHFPVS